MGPSSAESTVQGQDPKRLLLGGFSQGVAVVIEAALSFETKTSPLILLRGAALSTGSSATEEELCHMQAEQRPIRGEPGPGAPRALGSSLQRRERHGELPAAPAGGAAAPGGGRDLGTRLRTGQAWGNLRPKEVTDGDQDLEDLDLDD
eukprot:Skav226985  [mRNA]  locus=scaffold1937:131719:133157:+ [translate_table: standard]